MVNFIKFKKKVWKIKFIFCLIYLFNYNLIINKYFKFRKIINNIKLTELKYYLNNFACLVKKPFNLTDDLLIEEKKQIIKLLLQGSKQNISYIDTIFLNKTCNFGNCLIFLNKLIFYCEIIGCKNIILNKNIYWFIKNNITINNYNIKIIIDEYKNYVNSSILIYNSWDIFFSFFKIKPEIRINYLRNEILLNLPKIITYENDLYIHIRSGDIFIHHPHRPYAQPPLCFYKNILNNFKYRNIYLISQDNKNPVIEKLIKKFPNVIYSKNSLKEDISLLINAYKIVNSISSFVNSIIQLNYNLLFLWEYNIYHMDEKIFAYHHDYNTYSHNNFTIFRMEPSSLYVNKMYEWKNTRSQIILMLKEKCINEFFVFKREN